MAISVMLYQDWQLTLLALVPLPFVSYAVYILGKIVNAKFEERQKTYSDLTTRAQENLSGIRVIRAYVREQHEIGLFRTLSWDYLKKNLVLARVQSIMWPLMFLLVGFSLVITLYFGGLRVIHGEITIGTLTAFFGYLVMLIWPMIAFGWVVNILQQGSASMSRLGKILDTEPEIRDTPTDGSLHHLDRWGDRIPGRGLSAQECQPPGARRDQSLDPGRHDAGHRGIHGLGQEHAGQSYPAPLRRHGRGAADRRRGCPQDPAGGPARLHRVRSAGDVPVLRFDRREHQLRRATRRPMDEVKRAAEISQISQDIEGFPRGYRDQFLANAGSLFPAGRSSAPASHGRCCASRRS